MTESDQFLSGLSRLKTATTYDRTDYIYTQLSALMKEKRFDVLDTILANLDVEQLTAFDIRSILVNVYSARPLLKNREPFIELAVPRYLAAGGQIERLQSVI